MARKVLIVEDDGNIAELLHLYLEKELLRPPWPGGRPEGPGAVQQLSAGSGAAGHHAARHGRLVGAARSARPPKCPSSC